MCDPTEHQKTLYDDAKSETDCMEFTKKEGAKLFLACPMDHKFYCYAYNKPVIDTCDLWYDGSCSTYRVLEDETGNNFGRHY